MPFRFCCCLLVILWPALAADRKPVTLEALASARPPEAGGPLLWAPDGKRFAYLDGGSYWLYEIPSRSRRELFATRPLDTAARKPAPETAFRFENRRVTERRFQWLPSGDDALILAGGDLFLYHLAAGKWDQLTDTAAAERDPKVSPDGARVSFRRDHELYSMELGTRQVARLTHDATDTLWNGELDWVYPEELELGTAHWWSPDSRHIAYLQFDVSRESVYPHVDLRNLRAILEPQRYPQAGTPNADVRVGIVPAAGGETRWMDFGETRDVLLARLDWLPDSRFVAAQRLNRVQNRLDLLVADIATGASRLLLRETDPAWVNVSGDLRFLENSDRFLWSSERSGFRHLYLYSMDGTELAQLTRGNWEVTSVVAADRTAQVAYFLSTEVSPLERHLHKVRFDGEQRSRITTVPGTHAISMGPTREYYVDSVSNLSQPLWRTVHRLDGAEWSVYAEADRKALEEYELLPTEIVRFNAPDGTLLYGRLVKPAGFQPGRRYPGIVMVYGGPHAQAVRDVWAGMSLDQALAHKGYVIWQVDNRGSGGRGHAWEAKLFRRLGEQELADQRAGVKHLLSLGFVDPARVGIHGYSYGGFMTLYALMHAPDLFRAGVAGAPVTDWRNYDTIYTERYLGLPQDNPNGYRLSSPVHFASHLQGRLLLLHNIEDDNVLFQNTLQMMVALQSAGKQFETRIYPQKSHGVTGSSRRHMHEALAAFFDQHLK